MPTYRFTDPKTGRKLKFTGASPPTEQQLNEAFSKLPSKESPIPPKENKPSFMEGAGGRLKGMVEGILGIPQSLMNTNDPFESENTELPGFDPREEVEPLGGLVEALRQGGANSAQPFLEQADKNPENAGLRNLQAALSTVPLPGFGPTVASGEGMVDPNPNNPFVRNEGALGELGVDAVTALAPKIAPAIGKGIGRTGEAIGAPIRTNAVSRMAARQSVPFEKAPRVSTPWRGNPISWARSGVEELQNMLRSPRVANAQTKLADLLHPAGKIDPDLVRNLGQASEPVIQGPDNPLPPIEPNPQSGMPPVNRSTTPGPSFVPPEEPLDLSLNLDFPEPKPNRIPSNANPYGPLDEPKIPLQGQGPLAGMAQDKGFDPSSRPRIQTPEELRAQEALSLQQEIERIFGLEENQLAKSPWYRPGVR